MQERPIISHRFSWIVDGHLVELPDPLGPDFEASHLDELSSAQLDDLRVMLAEELRGLATSVVLAAPFGADLVEALEARRDELRRRLASVEQALATKTA